MLKASFAVVTGVATVVGFGVGVAACSASASSASSEENSGTDGGSGGNGGGNGGSLEAGSAAVDASALPPEDAAGDAGVNTPPATTVLFVNAMPSALSQDSALQFCWAPAAADPNAGVSGLAFGSAVPYPTGPMPESNYPGVALGSSVLLADASFLASQEVTFVAIPSLNLAELHGGAMPCGDIFKTEGIPFLGAGAYFVLPPVQITARASNVVAVEGCAPVALAPNASTRACGADWDAATGNLRAKVYTLAPATTGGGRTGGGLLVQVAQLSPGLASLLATGGSASVWFGSGSSTTGQPIASVGALGDLMPMAPALVDATADGSVAYDGLGFHLQLPRADGGPDDLFLTMTQALGLVDPTADPALYFGSRGTYVVAIVGDPSAPPPSFLAAPASGEDAGVYDGTGLHLVVAPTQP